MAWGTGVGGEEQETVEGCLRQSDFLDDEVVMIDRKLARWVAGSAQTRWLMSIPVSVPVSRWR